MTWANGAMLAASVGLVLLPWRLGSLPTRWAAALVLVIAAALSVVEGWRWQLWPIFAVAAMAFVWFFVARRRTAPSPAGLTPRRAVAAGAFVLLAALAALPSLVFPVFDYPRPSGPLGVGVQDIMIDAGNRPGEQPLLVRAWYPTDATDGVRFSRPEAEVALEARQLGEIGMPGVLFRHLHLPRAHALVAAPVASLRSRYPTILFSHGGEGSVSTNVSLAENLASYGYIVLSVSFPGYSAGLISPDGREVPIKERRYEEIWDILEGTRATSRAHALTKIRSGLERTKNLNEMVWLRLHEMQRVLNAIDAGTNPLFKAVDRQQIGAVGHSFGGATAALTCHIDQRVRACANIDGFQFGKRLLEEPIRAPLLVVYGDHGTAFSDLFYRRPDGTADVPVEYYIIRGAGHADLTDLTYWTPLKKRLNDAVIGKPRPDGELASRVSEVALFGTIGPDRASSALSTLIINFLVKRTGFALPAGELPQLSEDVIRYTPGSQWSENRSL
jgi:predicted dienelactone hydrolase